MRMLKRFENNLIMSRDKIKKNPAKLGQAVYDILSKEQYSQTAEQTIDAMTPKYFEELSKCVDIGCKEQKSPFYIVVKRIKESIGGTVANVLKQTFLNCPKRPTAKFLREDHPYADYDLYEVYSNKGKMTLLYTLLNAQDSKTVLKNPDLYDPKLVEWIVAYNRGTLDLPAVAADN
jgi:hypothetical protein